MTVVKEMALRDWLKENDEDSRYLSPKKVETFLFLYEAFELFDRITTGNKAEA